MLRYKEFFKKDLETLKIWWNFAFEEGDTEIFNKCSDYFEKKYGEYLDIRRCWKVNKKWKEIKNKDLCYVPSIKNALNTDGILEYIYKKDDIIRLCGECKPVAEKVFQQLRGERVEEAFENIKQMYYDYYMNEERSDMERSVVGKCIYSLLSEEKKADIDKVMKERKEMKDSATENIGGGVVNMESNMR